MTIRTDTSRSQAGADEGLARRQARAAGAPRPLTPREIESVVGGIVANDLGPDNVQKKSRFDGSSKDAAY